MKQGIVSMVMAFTEGIWFEKHVWKLLIFILWCPSVQNQRNLWLWSIYKEGLPWPVCQMWPAQQFLPGLQSKDVGSNLVASGGLPSDWTLLIQLALLKGCWPLPYDISGTKFCCLLLWCKSIGTTIVASVFIEKRTWSIQRILGNQTHTCFSDI